MKTLQNYVGGSWVDITGTDSAAVTNPAAGATIAIHPHSNNPDVDAAVAAAGAAFWDWRITPTPTRSAMLFRYRHLVWEAQDELASIIVEENGKKLAEAKGEMLRTLQYIEHASAVTETMKGAVTENVGTAVDIEYIREPLGPFAIIAPFNFPAMIPLYFTWAAATGNPVIVKPSEHCLLTTIRLVELAQQAGFPDGVVNMVLGKKTVVERHAEHPDVVGKSFVGSSEIAETAYKLTIGHRRRCQAQGGSKNHLVVTDTAALDRCMPNIVSSMLGNSSQRCFAGSNLVIYASIYDEFMSRFLDGVAAFRLGHGLDEAATMGPVISPESHRRLERRSTERWPRAARCCSTGVAPAGRSQPGRNQCWDPRPHRLLRGRGPEVFILDPYAAVPTMRSISIRTRKWLSARGTSTPLSNLPSTRLLRVEHESRGSGRRQQPAARD